MPKGVWKLHTMSGSLKSRRRQELGLGVAPRRAGSPRALLHPDISILIYPEHSRGHPRLSVPFDPRRSVPR